MICEACQDIFQGDLQRFERAESGFLVSDIKVHHVTKDAFIQAVGEHCQICNWIWRQLKNNDRMLALNGPSSFTKYTFADHNDRRGMMFYLNKDLFQNEEHIFGNAPGFPIDSVDLVPLKGLFHS